jgi:hypothetical protein
MDAAKEKKKGSVKRIMGAVGFFFLSTIENSKSSMVTQKAVTRELTTPV